MGWKTKLVKKMDDKTLKYTIEKQKWTESTTFKTIAPHEYILKKGNPKLFEELTKRIQENGFDKEFTIFKTTRVYRYWFFEGYKYWVIQEVLNREPKKG